MKYDAEVPEESGLGFDTRGYSVKEYEKLALLEGVGADLVFVGAGHAVSLTARELFKNAKFVSQAIAKIGAKDFYALRDKVLDKSADVVLTIKNDKISISEVGKKILHSANKLFEATSKLFQIFKKNTEYANGLPKGSIEIKSVGAAINKPAGFTVYQAPNGDWLYKSPGGIIYGPGSRHGDRSTHVLEHTRPNPNKARHSVFNTQTDKDALDLIDQAWSQKGSPLPGDPGVYNVPMSRNVGTAGETNIRIIVKPGTNQIILAYPQ